MDQFEITGEELKAQRDAMGGRCMDLEIIIARQARRIAELENQLAALKDGPKD